MPEKKEKDTSFFKNKDKNEGDEEEETMAPPTDTTDYSLLKTYWKLQDKKHVFRAPTVATAVAVGGAAATGGAGLAVSSAGATTASAVGVSSAGSGAAAASIPKKSVADGAASTHESSSAREKSYEKEGEENSGQQQQQIIRQPSAEATPHVDETKPTSTESMVTTTGETVDAAVAESLHDRAEEETEENAVQKTEVAKEIESSVDAITDVGSAANEAEVDTNQTPVGDDGDIKFKEFDSQLILTEGTDGKSNSGSEDNEESYVKIVRTPSGDPMTESELLSRPVFSLPESSSSSPQRGEGVENTKDDKEAEGGDERIIQEALSSETETFSVEEAAITTSAEEKMSITGAETARPPPLETSTDETTEEKGVDEGPASPDAAEDGNEGEGKKKTGKKKKKKKGKKK